MTKKILILIILFCISNYGFTQQNKQLENAKVDPRIELLSIVFRLADADEFKADYFKSYVSDINSYFAEYKNHEFINFIKEIRKEQGIGYDAVAKMAIHLSYPELKPIIPFSKNIPEKRWGKNIKSTEHFITLLQKFHKESNFQKFYSEHQNLYKIAEERFNKNVLNEIDLDWYPQFYGKVPNEKFTIILGMGFTGNFGVKIQVPNQKEIVYSILGAWGFDDDGNPVYTTKNGYTETIVHEFNHSFVNYLQDNIEKDLEPYGDKIYKIVKKDLNEQAYSDWLTALNEGLVRAAVIEYFASSKKADAKLKNEQFFHETYLRKFYWVPDLVSSIEIYQKNRDKFPTLESYMPNLIKAYEAVSKNPINTYKKNMELVFTLPINKNFNSPKIIDFSPKNNAQNISTDIKEIVLFFDKEMLYNYNIKQPPFPYSTIPIDSIKLSESKKEIHISLKRNLNENTEYGLAFGANFRSVDSLNLDKSYLYTFSTIPKPKINSTISKNKRDFKFTFSTTENRILTDLDGTPKIYLQTYLKNNKIKSIKLIGDFNDWNKENNKYRLTNVSENKYRISLSKKLLKNKSNFSFLINDEYLILPNHIDENVDYQPNYKYFKTE
ncbi:Ig-like domain-containing protein [Flavobacterium croceum DSM 17960]|uniref:Ig-like domain-containing protein n=1 Tax=Flavobacterium croceum DSM 17960 TaxID=1121886 RepID=A0A2S4NAI6_9FLAO|nr:DUF4932 domain-containing protein [Flavobacterium croceum]POS02700.1 Ig-like domain-containing protein [Flavobacterium croceum DSM 17960]